jgi:hypothetical protein
MNTINLKAYYATIQKKTGKTPADFRALAAAKGYLTDDKLRDDIKATTIFDWLKDDFGLGRGHGMAVYHSLKTGNEEGT